MNFGVKRVGNFLKISNKGAFAIYNLQHITFIDITKIFNDNYLSISHKNRRLILDNSIDYPEDTIDKICKEIEGWEYPTSVYNKKL
jgi:hypothetical protein